MIEVRDASADDLPAILAIYNDVIATTTAVYRDDPATLDDRQAWWQDRVAQGYPVLVADEGGAVLGFASFGDFRALAGLPVHGRAFGARAGRLSRAAASATR